MKIHIGVLEFYSDDGEDPIIFCDFDWDKAVTKAANHTKQMILSGTSATGFNEITQKDLEPFDLPIEVWQERPIGPNRTTENNLAWLARVKDHTTFAWLSWQEDDVELP